MDAGHAILAPSSAARWVACAGSALLEAIYPDTDSDKRAADEGTAAHFAASELLLGQVVATGQVAPNGIVLTDEMLEAAEMYVDAVLAKLGEHSREFLHVEQRVMIPSVHEHNWGTPDCRFMLHNPTAGRSTLYLFDFKFGHDFVDVFENWQLIDYAAGILDEMGVNGIADQMIDVEFCIVQPRNYHRDGPVRTWRVVASDLRPFINRLSNAADRAMRPDAPTTPNPQCLHCKGRHACEALQRDAYRSAAISASSVPVEMSPEALGLELHMLRRAAKRLEGRITGLEEQARIQLQRGQRVSFHALETVPGREAWTVPADQAIALGQLLEIDISKPGVLTPKQARDKGVPADVVASISARPSSLKLVEDDGRDARKVFGK